MKILLAGDGFLTPEVLEEAVTSELPDATTTVIQSGWPVTPFGDVSEVKEACGDEDELIEALAGCEVAFTHTYPFTDRVIKASPDLKMITVCRGGPVNVNIDAATEAGVLVSFAPGRNARATAEHSVAMIMAAARSIAQRDAELKADQWRGDLYKFEEAGQEIGSSTVGVIGFGAVGAKVGHVMAAMGARVLVYDPWAAPEALEGVEAVELDDLLAQSDIVTIHARVTKDNHHMINAETIGKMKKGAIFVNCARGPLADADALCDALDSGHLRHVALDCLPEEPLPVGHRLTRTPNVTLTPHIAGASQEAARIAARIGSADIAALARGEKPTHLANPTIWKD